MPMEITILHFFEIKDVSHLVIIHTLNLSIFEINLNTNLTSISSSLL